MADPIVAAIMRGSQRRGLDPNAVLAVSSTEGLYDPTGDVIGGRPTSFGPFMLHEQGALPRQLWGRPVAAQRWATSQAGIDYALDRIARVARGKRGRAAIAAIVSQFERPANVGAEIAKAAGRYGRVGGGGGALASPSLGAARPPAVGQAPDLTGLFNLTREIVGLPGLSTSAYAPIQAPALQARRPYARAKPVNMGGPAVMKRGRTINYLIHFASPYGLTVTSTTSGGHVKGSYHYSGRAVDFGGDPSRMAALANAALRHPQDFVEMFYSGPGNPGYYIKNGRVYPIAQLDRSVYEHHKNHVHLAR